MAGELIRLDHKHISIEQMKMSVDRVLQCYIHNMSGPPSLLIENYLGKRVLARVHYRPGVQVGPKTHQRVDKEVETRDTHIPSSMRRMYHHFGGHAVTIVIVGGWVRTHRVHSIC
ncbi:hypothetical protein Gotur_014812 [Gossypium turneri]